MRGNERRSARLLFWPELQAGTIDESALEHPMVTRAVLSRTIPSRPSRAYQRLLMKRGRLSYAAYSAAPMQAARVAVLGKEGAAAAGGPRFLVRMDEYPHWHTLDDPERFGDAAFAKWHEIMSEAGCAHLVAVVPHPSVRPDDPEGTEGRDLSDEEVARLAHLRRDGVSFGLHGYDHRTRHTHPRRQSELLGLNRRELNERLDRAEAVLAERAAIRPRVFVPPFNRFSPEHYDVLAARYDVICGGPESVAQVGFHATPLFRGETVYLPCYPPLYGTAAEVLAAAARALASGFSLWMPITLHWGWEADQGWEDLRRLADLIAPRAVEWSAFLEAVEGSR